VAKVKTMLHRACLPCPDACITFGPKCCAQSSARRVS
jgi:hypothetical protein